MVTGTGVIRTLLLLLFRSSFFCYGQGGNTATETGVQVNQVGTLGMGFHHFYYAFTYIYSEIMN